MKLTKSQSGFTVLHILLLLVLLGIIGFAGWKVYDASKSTKPTASSSTPPASTQQPNTAKIPDGFEEYENKELGFKFAYPKEWGNAMLDVRSKDNGYGCQDQTLIKQFKVTGQIYHISFANNKEKSIGFQSKDFSYAGYYPCITLSGVIGAGFYEHSKGLGFYKDGASEFIAGDDNYECGLDNYLLYAVKPLNTQKINGISVLLHSLKSPYDNCEDHPDMKEKIKATLTIEDKKVMESFKTL